MVKALDDAAAPAPCAGALADPDDEPTSHHGKDEARVDAGSSCRGDDFCGEEWSVLAEERGSWLMLICPSWLMVGVCAVDEVDKVDEAIRKR